jgi:hypothetical protein
MPRLSCLYFGRTRALQMLAEQRVLVEGRGADPKRAVDVQAQALYRERWDDVNGKALAHHGFRRGISEAGPAGD